MKKLALIFFVSILSIVGTFAQSNIEFNTSVEGIKQYTLKTNGLKILLIPDKSSSNVTVNIVYEVGSRHEGYGESGMAHLLEHMLFRSCKNFTDIKKAIADKGAFANGTTYYDRTNYYEILSASDSNLNWAIAMEADRMVNAKILQEELSTEFSVVRNEFEIGENNPSRVLRERILSTMYLWHNYGKSTIGSKEDIERVKADRLREFYKKYYRPDNATIIIGGKFDEKKALQYIETQFSVIPKPTRVLEPTYTLEPTQDGERFVELKRNGDIQYIAAAYHTPSFADKNYVANEAAVEILYNDPNGILYKSLVETKLATKVEGYASSFRDASFSYFQVDVPKDKDIKVAQNKLFSILDHLDTLTITQEDVTRAKNSLLKYWDDVNNNSQRLTTTMTEIIGAGDWRLWYIYRDNVEKLTVADVKKALNTYYKPSNKTWGTFTPDSNAIKNRVNITEVTNDDIQNLVKNYVGKKVDNTTEYNVNMDTIIKKTIYSKTKNGAQYAVFSKPTKSDIINAKIRLNLGSEATLQNTAMRNDILAQLLREGTKTKTKSEINDALDKLKADVQISGNNESVTIRIKTTKENFPATMNILNDILRNPKLSETDFKKVVDENIAEYEKYQNDPRNVAFSTKDKVSKNYPKSHPYYAADIAEELATLKNLKLQEVVSFYNQFYGGNNAIATFVGAVDKKEVDKQMQTIFGSWNAKTPYVNINEKYFDIKGRTEIINISDKSNAALAGNVNLSISQKDIDYPAVYMANQLLGGGAFLGSRIPQRLREKEGFSYGAGSFLNVNETDAVGNWGLYAFFNPKFQKQLDTALLDEINKAIKDGFTQDELSKSKASWLQGEQTILGMDNAVASTLSDYMQHKKDLKEYQQFQNKINALTLSQVNAALKKYFDINKLILIYAGDFNKK